VAAVGDLQIPEKQPYMTPITITLAISLRAIMDMLIAPHMTVDKIVALTVPM
jgi:hypothetical protein